MNELLLALADVVLMQASKAKAGQDGCITCGVLADFEIWDIGGGSFPACATHKQSLIEKYKLFPQRIEHVNGPVQRLAELVMRARDTQR